MKQLLITTIAAVVLVGCPALSVSFGSWLLIESAGAEGIGFDHGQQADSRFTDSHLSLKEQRC